MVFTTPKHNLSTQLDPLSGNDLIELHHDGMHDLLGKMVSELHLEREMAEIFVVIMLINSHPHSLIVWSCTFPHSPFFTLLLLIIKFE